MNVKLPAIDKIITESISLFFKHSYANTTLQQISTATELGMGSIYHAFPKGKPDIATKIMEQYLSQNTLLLGQILKTNAVDSTIEQIVDSMIATLLELGNKFPCVYDDTFVIALGANMDGFNKLQSEIIEYTAIMIQLKFPQMPKDQINLKAKICYTIWDSLLCEYEKSQDEQILTQIKILTLKYLND
jgi:AcrR family transcriptional regulator